MSCHRKVITVADDIIAGGLCDVMERALIDRGIAPDIARKLAEKACAPTVGKVEEKVKKTAKRKLSAYDRALKKALNKVNATVRTKSGKLRKGVTQADVMRRAHRLARKMVK